MGRQPKNPALDPPVDGERVDLDRGFNELTRGFYAAPPADLNQDDEEPAEGG
jgi:hypothetical protein